MKQIHTVWKKDFRTYSVYWLFNKVSQSFAANQIIQIEWITKKKGVIKSIIELFFYAFLLEKYQCCIHCIALHFNKQITSFFITHFTNIRLFSFPSNNSVWVFIIFVRNMLSFTSDRFECLLLRLLYAMFFLQFIRHTCALYTLLISFIECPIGVLCVCLFVFMYNVYICLCVIVFYLYFYIYIIYVFFFILFCCHFCLHSCKKKENTHSFNESI